MLKFVEVDLNLFPVYDILTEETEKDIGYIELEIQSESVYVADMEIYDKRKGNGRLVITQLLKNIRKSLGTPFILL